MLLLTLKAKAEQEAKEMAEMLASASRKGTFEGDDESVIEGGLAT